MAACADEAFPRENDLGRLWGTGRGWEITLRLTGADRGPAKRDVYGRPRVRETVDEGSS